MKRSLIALLVALVMMLSVIALASCGDTSGDDVNNDTNIGTTPDDVQAGSSRLDLSQYTIYYALDTGNKTSLALNSLLSLLRSAYGIQVRANIDFLMPDEQVPVGTKEILIGNTNRPESAALISDDDNAFSYHVSFDGTRLCVAGGSDEAIANGVYHLIAMMKSDGLYIDEGYRFDYAENYPCTSLKINGEPIDSYTIAYTASELSRSFATELRNVIEEYTGIKLKTKATVNAGSEKIIVADMKESLGADFISDDEGYGVYVEDGNLKIAYTSGNSAYKALGMVKEILTGDVNLTDGYQNAKQLEVLKVAIIGDSNTRSGQVQGWLDVYLTTRYPDMIIELENKGIGGDTAEGAYERLDWDILPYEPDVAIVTFGGNGIRTSVGTLNGVTPSPVVVSQKIAWYKEYMTKLTEDLASRGIEVIIASPAVYDEWLDMQSDNYKNTQETFGLLTEWMKEYSQSKGFEFVDAYSQLLKITRDYRLATGDTSKALMNDDRVHLNMKGAFVRAYAYIIESRWASDNVATVSIDTGKDTIGTNNADATLKIAYSNYVNLEYSPLSLPMPNNEHYQSVKAYNAIPLDEYNDEIIKVTGLDDGEYDIMFDGVVIATVTASELADGVNIALLEKNPSQKASLNLFKQLDVKRINKAEARAESYIDKNYLHRYNIVLSTPEEKVAHYKKAIADGTAPENIVSYMEDYIDMVEKNEFATDIAANHLADFNARVLAQADTYTVEIIKK